MLKFSVHLDLDLDTLLFMIGGGMIVVTILSLSIIVICLRTICNDRHDYQIEGRIVQPTNTSPIPAPPPMPQHENNTNCNLAEISGHLRNSKNSFSAPVWFDEIQNNRVFQKLRIELSENAEESDTDVDAENNNKQVEENQEMDLCKTCDAQHFVIHVSGSSVI